MFPTTSYLRWALRWYGSVRFDLASSGIPRVAWDEVDERRGPPAGVDDLATFARLREAIARYNDRPVAEVVPAVGTSQALFLAYAALLSPGDEILVEHPVYEPLVRAAEGLGATVRTFPRREERGFAIDADDVASLVGPRTRAIVVTTLHNPSGARVSEATLRDLAAIADARGAYLVVDEVYAPFDDGLAFDGVFRKSARKLASNVVAVGSLTKCYGLGMHRIGWVLAPEEVAGFAESAAVATVGHLPLSHAAYGVAALANVGKLAERARSLVAGKRDVVDRWARSLSNATWSAPTKGLFGLVTIDGADDLLRDIERLAAERGVLVAAGSFFGAPRSFRVSWASCDAADLEKALGLLEPLVRRANR